MLLVPVHYVMTMHPRPRRPRSFFFDFLGRSVPYRHVPTLMDLIQVEDNLNSWDRSYGQYRPSNPSSKGSIVQGKAFGDTSVGDRLTHHMLHQHYGGESVWEDVSALIRQKKLCYIITVVTIVNLFFAFLYWARARDYFKPSSPSPELLKFNCVLFLLLVHVFVYFSPGYQQHLTFDDHANWPQTVSYISFLLTRSEDDPQIRIAN
jgi:hypothetical protein